MATRSDRKNENLIYGLRSKRVAGDEVVLGEFHQGPRTSGLHCEAEYKRATLTSVDISRLSLAKTEAPI